MSLTPEQEALSAALTNLQRLTVLGVVEGKSQRQAYYDAGGKAKTDESADATASEILSAPMVRAFHESLLAASTTDAILTREKALERLTFMATTEITDILEFRTVEVMRTGKDGEEEPVEETIWLMKDSPEIKRRASASIKSVTMTKQGPKIEMYDARDAIAQLSKMQGWEAAQKFEHTGANGGPMQMATLADFYTQDEAKP